MKFGSSKMHLRPNPIAYSLIASVTSQSQEMKLKWAVTCDYQQCGILTRVDSEKPVQPIFMRRTSKWCSVSSLTVIKCTSDLKRLWPDSAYAQTDLRLCWPHIPHCHTLYAGCNIFVYIADQKQPNTSRARIDCGKLTLFLLLQTLKRGVASQGFAEKHSVPTFMFRHK